MAQVRRLKPRQAPAESVFLPHSSFKWPGLSLLRSREEPAAQKSTAAVALHGSPIGFRPVQVRPRWRAPIAGGQPPRLRPPGSGRRRSAQTQPRSGKAGGSPRTRRSSLCVLSVRYVTIKTIFRIARLDFDSGTAFYILTNGGFGYNSVSQIGPSVIKSTAKRVSPR